MNDVKIEMLPYCEEFAKIFQQESIYISSVLGKNCKAIYHIGSTSIPGLLAKPTIDIVAEVGNILLIDHYNQSMLGIDYVAKGEYGIPFRRYFNKRDNCPTFNLHVFEHGSPEIEKFLTFRNFLCAVPSEKDAYLALKTRLAEAHPNDMTAYSIGKNLFIQQILEKAGFNKLCLLHPFSLEDNASFRRIHKEVCSENFYPFYQLEEFCDKNKISKQFILNKGVETVGITQLAFLENNSAVLELFEISKIHQNHGYGAYLIEIITKWLNYQNINMLYVYSTKENIGFFQKFGFSYMTLENKNYRGLPSGTTRLGKGI